MVTGKAPERSIPMNRTIRPLFLEVFGYSKESAAKDPRTVAGRVIACVKCIEKAYMAPASTYGRLLRTSGQITVALGATGHELKFGQDSDHIPPTQWLATKKEALATLREISIFGNFTGCIMEINAITDETKKTVKIQEFINKTRKLGGYPTEGKRVLRTVGRVFDMHAILTVFLGWRKAVEDAEKQADAVIAEQKAVAACVQEQRIEAIVADGIPGVVAETPVLSASEELQALAESYKSDPEKLTKLLEAARAM